ncbi:MAG: hypothetical protein ACREBH_02365 [Candidatus Micrarchaeaceae archaeon]
MEHIKVMFVSLLILAFVSAVPHAADCGLVTPIIASQISANEPWYCAINQQIYTQWMAFLPAAVAVIMLSFVIAAVLFMVGVALNNGRLRNFGIGEFYEAIATAIIVALFVYLCAIVFGILPGVVVGSINPYATSFYLMTKTIYTAQQMYTSLFYIYLSMSYTTTPTISLSIGGAIGGIAKTFLSFIGFVPQLFVNIYAIPVTIYFLDPAIAIAGFLTDGIAVLYAQYYMLVFFAAAAIPAFLIPGVFFRALFPTRALGGILIAMAFGFYLIMPALFSVAYYFTAPTIQSDMSVSTLQLQKLSYNDQAALTSTSPLVEQLLNVKSSLNGFWLMIFFYPILIIAVTYTSIVELANFIGRTSKMGGRIRRFI